MPKQSRWMRAACLHRGVIFVALLQGLLGCFTGTRRNLYMGGGLTLLTIAVSDGRVVRGIMRSKCSNHTALFVKSRFRVWVQRVG